MRYRPYIQSLDWRNNSARQSELARCRGRCRLCFKRGSRRSPLEVHHATYVRLGREIAGDLIALCPTCHLDVETFLGRRRFAHRAPPRADVVSLRDRRRPLVDPTR